jgi:hypothetical protein
MQQLLSVLPEGECAQAISQLFRLPEASAYNIIMDFFRVIIVRNIRLLDITRTVVGMGGNCW